MRVTYSEMGLASFRQVLIKLGSDDIDAFEITNLNLRENSIQEVKFLDSFPELQNLKLRRNDISKMQGFFGVPKLKVLDLSENKISVIQNLNDVPNLQNLDLDSNNISRISGLNNVSNLRNLDLDSNNIRRISGLNNVSKLRQLRLSFNQISVINGLDNLPVLKKLSLSYNNISRVSGLDSLPSLQNLDLSHNKISRVSGLNSLSALQRLNLYGNNISKINGLDNLSNLQVLNLMSNKISRISGLDNLVNLQELDLSFNKISKIDNLENLVNLTELNLHYNPLKTKCIETLLDYKRRGQLPKLKKVDLRSSKINWYNPKAGRAAWELKNKYGIEIIADDIQYNPPSKTITDHIDKFLSQLSLNPIQKQALKRDLLEEYQVQRFGNISLDKSGFTSKGVIKVGGIAIKVDVIGRLDKEFTFYKEVRGSSFQAFCPTLYRDLERSYTTFEGIGFLAMSNLDNDLVPGFMKFNSAFGTSFKGYSFDYYLSLISLFHSSMADASKKYKDSLPLQVFIGSDGLPYHPCGDVPGVNHIGQAFEAWKKTRVPDISKSHAKHYASVKESLHSQGALVIIDGDWKAENLYHGHKVDFSCVGLGLEIDDFAYYLSDFNHDRKFGFHDFKRIMSERSVRQEPLLSYSWLANLCIRHNVMCKRDLNNPQKLQQRQYYQHRINEVLREGRFV